MKNRNVLAALLLLAPFIYLAGVWASLPALVPLHFNFNGAPHHYGSKRDLLTGEFVLGFVSLLIYILFSNLHRLTKKAPVENKERMQKMALAVLAFMAGVQCWLAYLTEGAALTSSLKFLLAGVCLLFAVIGNYMPNLKPNYFAGFRLPWTLNNEDNWRKTHYIAGHLWFAGGLACVVVWLLLPFEAAAIVGGILFLIMLVFPAVYSYRLSRQLK